MEQLLCDANKCIIYTCNKVQCIYTNKYIYIYYTLSLLLLSLHYYGDYYFVIIVRNSTI